MTKRTVKQKSKGTKRTTAPAQNQSLDAASAGAKIANEMIASVERLPAEARYAAVEGVIARLTELVQDDAPKDAPKVLMPDSDAATQLAFLKDHLVRATDLMSETLASVTSQDESDTFDVDGIRANLNDVHLALWRIRWECYVMAGEVGVKAKQAAGGAS